MSHRLFVALPVPEEVHGVLAAARRAAEGETGSSDIRWQDPARSHLTLCFLGNVSEADIPHCESALAGAARRSRAFTLRTGSLGAFPSNSRPSVLWLGVTGDLAGLHALQRDLADRLGPRLYRESDRDFRPHLTLGRVRRVTGTDREALSRLLGTAPGVGQQWRAGSVQLLRSRLRPEGAVHELLFERELNGGTDGPSG